MEAKWAPFVRSEQPDFEAYKKEWLKAYHDYGLTLMRFNRRPEPHLRAIANLFTRPEPVTPQEIARLKEKAGATPSWLDDLEAIAGQPESWQDYVSWLEQRYDQRSRHLKDALFRYGSQNLYLGLLGFLFLFLSAHQLWLYQTKDSYQISLGVLSYALVFAGGCGLIAVKWPGLSGRWTGFQLDE